MNRASTISTCSCCCCCGFFIRALTLVVGFLSFSLFFYQYLPDLSFSLSYCCSFLLSVEERKKNLFFSLLASVARPFFIIGQFSLGQLSQCVLADRSAKKERSLLLHQPQLRAVGRSAGCRSVRPSIGFTRPFFFIKNNNLVLNFSDELAS